VVHARNQIISTFNALKSARHQRLLQDLQTIPCYTLYMRWRGNPPLPADQLHILHSRIQQANAYYKAGIDEDWRQSCLRYPEVLDYFFGLVEFSFPDPGDASVLDPRFGVPLREVRRVRSRRQSVDEGSTRGHRKRDKRGRTPLPTAPMVPR